MAKQIEKQKLARKRMNEAALDILQEGANGGGGLQGSSSSRSGVSSGLDGDSKAGKSGGGGRSKATSFGEREAAPSEPLTYQVEGITFITKSAAEVIGGSGGKPAMRAVDYDEEEEPVVNDDKVGFERQQQPLDKSGLSTTAPGFGRDEEVPEEEEEEEVMMAAETQEGKEAASKGKKKEEKAVSALKERVGTDQLSPSPGTWPFTSMIPRDNHDPTANAINPFLHAMHSKNNGLVEEEEKVRHRKKSKGGKLGCSQPMAACSIKGQ